MSNGVFVYMNESTLDQFLKRCGVDVSKENKLTQNEKARMWDFIDFFEVEEKAAWGHFCKNQYSHVKWDEALVVKGCDINRITAYLCFR